MMFRSRHLRWEARSKDGEKGLSAGDATSDDSEVYSEELELNIGDERVDELELDALLVGGVKGRRARDECLL
jgi:hypothetical protein